MAESKNTKKQAGFSFKKNLLTLLLLCLSLNISAQRVINLNDENIAVRATSSSVIPQEFLEEAKIARTFAINPALQRAEKVEIGDIIQLQLFCESNYKAEVVRTITDVNGNFTLTLSLPDYPFAFGFITTDTNGRSLISVSIPERNKEFASRGNVNSRTNYLIQIDENATIRLPSQPMEIPVEIEVFMEDEENIQRTNLRSNINCNPYAHLSGTDPARIDLLIVYTQAAATWSAQNEININNTIALAMAQADLVVNNQRNGDEIRLAGSVLLSDFTELSNDMSTDLRRLTDNANVQQLRRQHNADLVMLLGVYHDFGGMAWVMSNAETGNIHNGFSITRVQQARTFTPIHEIGHNMGMRHNVEDNSGNPLFPYAFGWRWTGNSGNRWLSVMSYQHPPGTLDRGTRVPFFSNPHELYDGRPTGTATANNAQVFRNVKHIIASYSNRLANLPDAPTNIVVSNPTDYGATISWDAVPNAVSYRLRVNMNGGWRVFNNILVPSRTFSTPDFMCPCQTYEFQVVAVNECGDETRGEILTFTTRCEATDPIVTTQAATNMTTTTATLNKMITPAEATVVSQGFRYRVAGTSTWLTSTTGNLTDLPKNTEFQFHAFVVTNLDTFNGSILTFATSACEPANKIIYTIDAMSGWGDPGWFDGAELRIRQDGIQVQAVAAYRFAPPDNPVIVPVPLCPCKDIDFVWISGRGNEGKSFAIKDNLGNVIFETPPHDPSGDPDAGAGAFVNNQVVFSTTTSCHQIANQLQIFPNPVQSELFIWSELQIQKVQIYSLTGVLLLEENSFVERISVSTLPTGVYILKVHTDKGLRTSKFVKR